VKVIVLPSIASFFIGFTAPHIGQVGTKVGRLERNVIIGNLRLTGDNQRDEIISTPEEFVRLYATMDTLVATGTPPLRPIVRAFAVIAAMTGMRRGELQKLRWGHVDLERRRLTLHDTKGAKPAQSGAKTESVNLPWRAADALAAIKREGALPSDLVFIPMRGEPMSVNRDWNRIRDAAELPAGLTLHGLRRSAPPPSSVGSACPKSRSCCGTGTSRRRAATSTSPTAISPASRIARPRIWARSQRARS
jgi:integrase